MPLDGFGRRASYLRLSITDRCNLQCVYCRSGNKQSFIPHNQILRYEDFHRLVILTHKMGIRKVRVTGGEPFARKGCVKFLYSLRNSLPDLNLAVTTNGTLLEPFLAELELVRPVSINISLDSFDQATYTGLTGKNLLPTVLNNIHSLLSRGVPVKINAVAIRGITDMQIADFVHAVKNLPIDMRFIEFMPIGNSSTWTESKFISSSELLTLIRSHAELAPSRKMSGKFNGPAHMYDIKGGAGRVGFISAISNHFCYSCNRLRITSEGRLRTCLFADKEYELAPLLAFNKDNEVEELIQSACMEKPLGARLLADRGKNPVAKRQMVAIGG